MKHTSKSRSTEAPGWLTKTLAGGIAAAIFTCLTLLVVDLARGSDYQVSLCNPSEGSPFSSRSFLNSNSGIITDSDDCGGIKGIGGRVVAAARSSSGKGAGMSHGWDAPAGTSISGLALDADIRRDKSWTARTFVSGRSKTVHRPTATPVAGFRRYTFDTALTGGRPASGLPDTGYSRIHFKLWCNVSVEGDRCSRDKVNASAYMKNMRLDLRDRVDPEVSLTSNRLFTQVNHGERGNITVGVTDQGSGVFQRTVRVNHQPLPSNMTGDRSYSSECQTSPMIPGVATAMVPCPTNPYSERVALDTIDEPFQLGVNTVEVCATDFSGRENCSSAEVNVQPIPVGIDQPGSSVGPDGSGTVEGQLDGDNGGDADGVVEAHDEQSGQWTQVGKFRSSRRATFSSRVNLNGVRGSIAKKLIPGKRVKKKIRKRMRNGKRRTVIRWVRRKPRKVTVSRFKVRARVVRTPNAYPGAVSKPVVLTKNGR